MFLRLSTEYGYVKYEIVKDVRQQLPFLSVDKFDYIDILWIEIFEEYRGKKLSYEFFEALEKIGKKKKCVLITLQVEYEEDYVTLTPHLIKLYKEYGFKKIGSENRMYKLIN